MATGNRSSFYRFPEIAEAVEASQLPVQVLLAQRLGLLPLDWRGERLRQSDLLLGEDRLEAPERFERVPVSRARPPAQLVRERRRQLRAEGLRVVAPHAGLPRDSNVGTPRAVFVPPPFETVPEHPDDGDE